VFGIFKRGDQFAHGFAVAEQGADNIPAIQHVSTLYENIERLTVNPSRQTGDTTELNTIRIDRNDYEPTLGDYDLPSGNTIDKDGVFGNHDREEEIMLAKWLHEVADNRSDVFAAYIVVQGYKANDFRAGPTESAKLIVLFSRDNVQKAGDRATEIARFRIK